MITLSQIKRYARITGIVLILLLALVGILSIGRCNRNNGIVSKISTQVDTLYLHDTIRLKKPVPKIIKNIDTFLLKIKDTIWIKDTVYLNVPKEQKIYKEEDYQAWISGYRPELDSIHIYRNTQQIITSTTIQQKQKRSRWSIGIQAGYGFTLQNNEIKTAPNIGFGLSYNLLVF